MSGLLDKIQIFISLIAALAIVVIGIVRDIELQEMAFNLIVVICVSYIAGLLLRTYIKKVVEPDDGQYEDVATVIDEANINDGDIDEDEDEDD